MGPSGRQIRLAAGDTEAVVVEVGGGIRSFRVGGHDVIDGYAESELVTGGRGQVLAPWPNRVRDGKWSWQGRSLQLPLSEVLNSNASHGLARWLVWGVDEQTATTATLSATVAPQSGWPFRIHVTTAYELAEGSLTVTLSARNDSDEPAPVGLGMHPYFTAGTEFVDTSELHFAATGKLVLDDRLLPVGDEESPGWAGPIGDAVVDGCWTGLARDADGLARVRVVGEHTVTVWMDQTWKWLQVFTGDTLPAEHKRRGLALEPQSCPGDALNSGRDLVTLQPGETLSGRWGVQSS